MKPLRTLTSLVLAMLAFTANAQEGAWNGELDVTSLLSSPRSVKPIPTKSPSSTW